MSLPDNLPGRNSNNKRYRVDQFVSHIWIEKINGVNCIKCKMLKMLYDTKENRYLLDNTEEYIK